MVYRGLLILVSFRYLLVMEITKLAMDIELLLVASLYAANDLCIDAKALADFDDALSFVGGEVNLHTVTHIEHLIHL